jgi:alpha/beta superfamily hydrolase
MMENNVVEALVGAFTNRGFSMLRLNFISAVVVPDKHRPM